jgi:hypothetical protein
MHHAPLCERGSLHELEQNHLGRVALARSELDDAGVAAWSVGVARGDDLEQLANLSWPSAESAWRRAWRSPRLASVISFSISGLAAFALAWVVVIRSCSITSFERLRSNDFRCAGSRLSL